ncbi:MAG: type IIL restriction-modification enzyme MmeI, partial [Myxococcales bacterium]
AGGKHGARRPFHWPIEFPEVMSRGGFDAIVGNPPFRGGKLITGILGTDYREYLVAQLAEGRKGNADLCAYFFLRAGSLLKNGGGFGLLATNTIAQGDTREVALDALVAKGYTITRAVPSRPWPGEANLEVAYVWMQRGAWKGECALDEKAVPAISPQLTRPARVTGNPFKLAANADLSFIGSYVLGLGFTLQPEQAGALIQADIRNKDVLFPYLNGQDLNSDPEQKASRWVVNFQDWPLDRASAPPGYEGPVAADYPDCLEIVQRLVKPERQRRNPKGDFVLRKPLPDRWWHYADKRPKLYATIAGMKRVLVTAEVSKHIILSHVPHGWVYSHMLVVFSVNSQVSFALLQGAFHEAWTRAHGSTLETRFRYTPTDCFDTFPFPPQDTPAWSALENIGDRYDTHRREVMRTHQEGLTKTYNRFHSPEERALSIAALRTLHVEMDEAVKCAYGWGDLALEHGFHTTKQGLRYTISEVARVEVLDRLLALNQERHALEVQVGGKEAGKKKKAPVAKRKAAPRKAKPQVSMGFDEEEAIHVDLRDQDMTEKKVKKYGK